MFTTLTNGFIFCRLRDTDRFGGHLDGISRQAKKKLVMPPLERGSPRGEGVP